MDFGTNYSGATECMVTVGGKHAIFGLTQALIEPGDDVCFEPVDHEMFFALEARAARGEIVALREALP